MGRNPDLSVPKSVVLREEEKEKAEAATEAGKEARTIEQMCL
jgi:hypothetical protein